MRENFTVARLRPAEMTEIERVREIERASASRFIGIGMVELAEDEPTAAETLARRISTGGLVVASDEAGAPVAFVMFREIDGCAYIEQLDVLPSHAGKRIGAALIDEVEARAREASWPALLLSTFKDVPWNAPYYRRLGFADVPDAELSDALRRIRAEHEARGLDETRRVFMRRQVARSA